MPSKFKSKDRGGRTGCAGCAIAYPLFYDFHKLSVEKEILKIGQYLTELGVNAICAPTFKQLPPPLLLHIAKSHHLHLLLHCIISFCFFIVLRFGYLAFFLSCFFLSCFFAILLFKCLAFWQIAF